MHLDLKPRSVQKRSPVERRGGKPLDDGIPHRMNADVIGMRRDQILRLRVRNTPCPDLMPARLTIAVNRGSDFTNGGHARSRQIVDTKHDARDAVVMRRPVERINDVRKPRILVKGILPEHGQHERRLCRTALLHFSDQVNAKKRSLGQVRRLRGHPEDDRQRDERQEKEKVHQKTAYPVKQRIGCGDA